MLLLRFQQPRFLRGRALLEHARAQLVVLAQQPVLAREILADARDRFARGRGDLLDRVGEDRKRHANRIQRVEAVVGDHQGYCGEREEGEAGEGARSPVEESWRVVRDYGWKARR